jgi:hypothetical protein
MTALAIHDIQRSTAAARADASLRAQLIKFLRSDTLVPKGHSELVDGTCDVINIALMEARKLYARNPERLACVIAASSMTNAYAIWGSPRYEWIVLTEGLLTKLRDAADEAGRRFSERIPEILASPLGKRILSIPPLSGGFKTTLGSLLYVAAVSFFVGHEAGHHLDGHDGYYTNGAHAEVESGMGEEAVADAMIKQALEFNADYYGSLISRRAVMHLLLKLVDIEAFSESEKRQYSRVIAVLLSAGALMALVTIRPQPIDWTSIEKVDHPPATLRAIGISAEFSVAFKEHFSFLTNTERRWIRLMVLELAAQGTFKSKSKEDKIFQQRASSNEPAALRAVGIRAALFDPLVPAYIESIRQHLQAVKPLLQRQRRAR